MGVCGVRVLASCVGLCQADEAISGDPQCSLSLLRDAVVAVVMLVHNARLVGLLQFDRISFVQGAAGRLGATRRDHENYP